MTHGLGESKVKVAINHPLPAFQGRGLDYSGINSQFVRVVKLCTLAGLLIFWKSRVHGYERLVTEFYDHRQQ